MGSYFVVLHSTPAGTGDIRRKFILELAKRLGRKEQEIDILLSDLPAVVTASPTKDFAEGLCQAIENLGGLAEMMAEVSGIHMAVGAKEKPAFKSSSTNVATGMSGAPKKPLQAAATVDHLKLESGHSFPRVGAEQQLGDPPAPKPWTEAEISLLAPTPENEAPEGEKFAPKEAGDDTPAAEPSKSDKAPAEKSGNSKSPSGMSVISPFSKAGDTRKTKSSSKWPAIRRSAPAEKTAAHASAPQASGVDQPLVSEDDVLGEQLEERVEVARAPKRKTRSVQQRILLRVLGVCVLCYAVLIIRPNLFSFNSEPGVTISPESIQKLLKAQDQILHDLNTKQDGPHVQVVHRFHGNEISGAGSLDLQLGETDGEFDSGSVELTTPAAPRLTPEEYSHGMKPRIWMKDVIAEKLRRTSNADELVGKAKVTLADENSLDKIVAAVVVKITREQDSEVISGTVDVFFPPLTEERPTSEVMERDAEGQVRIYHRRTFSARVVAPEDKHERLKSGGGDSKKPKPLAVVPVI